MNIKKISAVILLAAALMTLSSCKDKEPETVDTQNVEDTTPKTVENSELASDIPEEFLTPMNTLLSEWGLRKGSMSDPLIGARILMYEKTKDEVGYAILDIDGDGVQDMIAAPIDDFKKNAMVYDIVTIKDGKAWHLANSLEATYHFMADNSFILRTPAKDGAVSFKKVTLNGTERPTETPITEEEASKCIISQIELTPFSALEK